FLFSDEAYREFCYDGHQHISALQWEGMEDHAILMDTISKRYSACGGRVGAIASRNEQVMEAVMKFAQARLSPPSFAQILAEAAIDLPDSNFDAVHQEYTERRNLLVSRLNNMPGVFCPLPRGAFYAMASLPVDDSETFCQWLLESFEHEGRTVMLAPAEGFYATPGKGRNQVRLAYVLQQDHINLAMDCLQEALIQYPGRVPTE